MPGDSVDLEIGSASIKHQKPRVWETIRQPCGKQLQIMLQDFIVPLPQTAEKKETENEPSLYLKRPLVIMADSPQVCLFFTNPRKLIWKYYMEPENVPPNCQRRNIYKLVTLVSRGVFSPAFFSGDSEGESKKEVGATYHSASLGQFLCGLRNFLHQLWNLNSCNFFFEMDE